MMTARDDVDRLLEALRATFRAERAAIARLDVVELSRLAGEKQAASAALAEALGAVRTAGPLPAELRDRVADVRIEARATALLAGAAVGGVRALLGVQSTGYDRRAKRVSSIETRRLGVF